MTLSSQAAPLPAQTEHRRKSFALSNLKVADAESGEPEGTFTGIASAVGVLDRHGEVIEKGAFDVTLAKDGPTRVLLWQHNPSEPIGVIHLSVDARGDLIAKGELNMDVKRAQEAHSLMKQGALNAMSIGFNIPEGALKWDEVAKVLRILAVELWETSVVTFPANPGALVDGVKDDSDAAERICSIVHTVAEHAKAGKVLSAANVTKLETARDALQAVLDAAGLGTDSKSIGPSETNTELDGIKKLSAEWRAEIAERVST